MIVTQKRSGGIHPVAQVLLYQNSARGAVMAPQRKVEATRRHRAQAFSLEGMETL